MNILIIDTPETRESLMMLNSALNTDWNILSAKDEKECLTVYEKNNIDVVIVDFSLEGNLRLLDKITELNPSQRVITLSSNLESSQSSDCVDCIKKYNRRRVMKPLNLQELYHTIVNFDKMVCKYFKSFKDVDKVIPILLRNYNLCSYDNDNKTIYCDSSSEHLLTTQYYSILNELEKYNIKYSMLEEYNIKIKD
jgi:DNA-binding NarL/FixJ family response regulator